MIYACQKHGKNKTLTFSDASTPSNANSSLFPLLSEKEKKHYSLGGQAERSNFN